MKRTLLLLLPLAIACAQQPVEQPLNGQELINKFSGSWWVYNVENGEYEFEYWVIEPSGLCYLAINEGKLLSDYSASGNGTYQAAPALISSNEVKTINDYGRTETIKGKFYYTIRLEPRIKGYGRKDLAYSGRYIDSLDIWTNVWDYKWMEADNVYSGGVYELHRMKR